MAVNAVNDIGLRFPIGATFAAAARLPLSEGVSPKSNLIGEVIEGSLCRILAHSTTGIGGRLLVSWDGGIGWISCWTDGSRRPLLHQEWRTGEYLTSLREPLVKTQRFAAVISSAQRASSPPATRSTGTWEWWQW